MGTFVHSFSELDLSLTLRAGQVFCWTADESGCEWSGVITETVYMLRQDPQSGCISFSYDGGSQSSETEAIRTLRDFFQLDIDLSQYLDSWRSCDETFSRVIPPHSKFSGLRICRQDPWECLISFIVSANNNIKRISQNLQSIRRTYGEHIKGDHFTFPSIQQLQKATVEELRRLGLGYRAEYLVKSVAILSAEGQMEMLYGLRKESDVNVARNFLMTLSGVGRKVADCVCLYALDFPSVAPVDTHMYQIACRLFNRNIKSDKNMHDYIQKAMVDRFGEKAGWAHCFLFAADLRDLKSGEQDDSSSSKRARTRE